MTRDPAAIRSIVARAFLPDEWAELYPAAVRDGTPEAASEADRLATRWEQRLASLDERLFERRLESLGLDRDTARSRLTARLLPDDAKLPAWAPVLKEVLAGQDDGQAVAATKALGDLSDEEHGLWGLDVAPVPLVSELAVPFIAAAKRRLARAAGPVSLDPGGPLDPVWRYLLVRVSRIAARTLAYEVKRAAAAWRLDGETPEARYQAFVRTMLADVAGRRELFAAYPMLARLLAQSTLDTAAAVRDLLRALAQDRRAIARRFNEGRDPGAVIALTPGFSDPHRHGRTVCRLRFSAGLTLAWKPRRVAADVVFARIVERFNRGSRLTLRAPRVLDRGPHGWCEWIADGPCTHEAAVKRFYGRQGAQLALLYFLCGTDIHRENLIAAGDQPVIVDLEGLAAPGHHLERQLDPETPVEYRSMFTTVLATGMLPQWMAGDPDRALEVTSAIGGNAGRPYAVRWPAWRRTGTDEVHLDFHYPPRSESRNLPRIGTRVVPPARFLTEIADGFAAGYARARRLGAELLKTRGRPRLQTCDARVLVRPTREYYELLFWSWAPDQLVSGAAYDVALEMLCRGRELDAFSTRLLDDEKRCLLRGDIPIYTTRANARDLRGDRGSIGPAFAQSAFAQIRLRLARANDVDRDGQIVLIRASLRLASEPAGRLQPRARRASGSDLVGAAAAVADTLERLAIRDGRGARWLALARWPAPSRLVQPAMSNPWLHSGTAGTAIVCANLAGVTGVRRYADLADAALEYAWQTWRWLGGHDGPPLREKEEGERRRRIDPSAMTGAGSLVYAFAECGALLGDTRWIDRAAEVAHHSLVAHCPLPVAVLDPDLMGGLAGVVLALLRLHDARPDPEWIEHARALGAALLAAQAGEGEARGWPTPLSARPLAGMAHGAAGIAHALLRLSDRTREARFRDAALAGFAYERGIFSGPHQDWPNLQSRAAQPSFMTGWCAGAPGIGLSRLAALPLLAGAREAVRDVERDIETAIAATRRHLAGAQDHLCCGEAGRIMFLAEAGRAGWREAGVAARDAGAALVARYRATGAWNLHDFRERATQASLMSGAAGIALALLAAGGGAERAAAVLRLS